MAVLPTKGVFCNHEGMMCVAGLQKVPAVFLSRTEVLCEFLEAPTGEGTAFIVIQVCLAVLVLNHFLFFISYALIFLN